MLNAELVDMRKSPKKMEAEMAGGMSGPRSDIEAYPYGLQICLEKEQIDALNLMELPEPGEQYSIMASGTVTKASMEADGSEPRLEIQLTAIKLVPVNKEPAENEPAEKPGAGPMTILGNQYRQNG